MKKLLLSLFMAIATVSAFSQTVNFGIKAGLNLSQFAHGNTNEYNNGMLTGFSAGGILDIGFKSFSIQPGIFLSAKGEKDKAGLIELDQSGSGIASTTRLYYIEVPVNFLYKSKLARDITLHLGGGPYIGYGVSQTITINSADIPDDYTNHKFVYKNPDFGINFIAGLEINKRVIVDAGYGLGLVNLVSDGSTTYNRVISISFGYMFR